ncbi:MULTISPECIES: ABC transporter permease [unclassified Nocardioides]|uniref:ABC transporter permease n=1 Tax=unclassified Nocardioides TaxID=2615069 RepID=UPI000A632787|nr:MULTISPECIES: ABC transporter permease [unclassified Nocardioides]
MVRLLFRRAVAALVLMIAVAVAGFVITGLGNSDPGRSILGPQATAAQVEAENHRLGLDRSQVEQFTDWAGGVVRGDLGRSYLGDRPVTEKITNYLPVTMSLVALSMVVIAVLSLVLAVASVSGRAWVDRCVQLLAVIGHVLPGYLLALLLLLLFAVQFQLFPVFGYTPIGESPAQWLRGLALPVIALALGSVAGAALQARGALMDVLEADYVRTLRSRGIGGRSVLFRHALRNASPAWLTSLSLGFVALLAGAFMVEKVFALPGLGTLSVEATSSGDRPVLMGVVVLTGGLVVVVNLLVDLLQMWLIPKARTA